MKNPISSVKKYFAQHGTKRSDHWPVVRREHIKREPFCRSCGGAKNLEVHHIEPFHLDPAKELLDSNLITLCESAEQECHLHIGHLGNWKNYNPNVRAVCKATRRTH